jgi:ribosome-binding factor A
MQGLEDARVRIQSELNKRIKMKQTPHLHFHLDGSIERGSRIIHLMDELGLVDENPEPNE